MVVLRLANCGPYKIDQIQLEKIQLLGDLLLRARVYFLEVAHKLFLAKLEEDFDFLLAEFLLLRLPESDDWLLLRLHDQVRLEEHFLVALGHLRGLYSLSLGVVRATQAFQKVHR